MRRKQLLRIQGKSACLLLAVSIACSVYASRAANDEPPAPTRPAFVEAAPPTHFARITTLDGKSFEEVTVQKIQPDGLLVEFNLPGGGFGTAKLKFRNLPASVRERYGYEPREAEAFEAALAKGEQAWAAQNEAWNERREVALAEQMAREERLRDKARSDEAFRLAAERARAEQQAPPPQYSPYGSGFWYPGAWYPISPRNPHHHHRPGPPPHQGFPQQAPQSLPPSVPPFMSPMRPLGR